MGKLSLADQEGEAAGRRQEADGGGEDLVKAFDGAQGDGCGGRRGERPGASGIYIDSGQCKRPDHLAQEGYLLMVGFDEGDGGLRGPDFEGESGEASAGAYVDQAAVGLDWLRCVFRGGLVCCGPDWRGEQVAGGEEGFAEMAGDDLVRRTDGSEVDTGIPAD